MKEYKETVTRAEFYRRFKVPVEERRESLPKRVKNPSLPHSTRQYSLRCLQEQ